MTIPDFTTHADALFEANKPILGSVAQETKDNLLSVAGGGVDAPRVVLKAVERLVAGDEVRSRRDSISLNPAATAFTGLHSFGFSQIGTIRVIVERVTAGSEQMQVTRTRNGATTVVVAATTGNITADLSVIPGDELSLQGQTNPSLSVVYNSRFQTDGANLWPSGAARVEGNDVS